MKKFTITACAVFLCLLTGCGTNFLKDLSRDLKSDQDKPIPPPAPAVYCYNTLGNVTCYDKPQSSQDAGRFVGTSALPSEPINPDKQITGDTTLPKPEIGELPNVAPDQQKTEPPIDPSALGNEIEVKISPVMPHDPAMEMDLAKPVQPPFTDAGAVKLNTGNETNPGDSQLPDNKPLYDPFLNQYEQKPVDPAVMMPNQLSPDKNAQPIVPPKKKTKKSKSAAHPKPKPKAKPQPQPAQPQ